MPVAFFTYSLAYFDRVNHSIGSAESDRTGRQAHSGIVGEIHNRTIPAPSSMSRKEMSVAGSLTNRPLQVLTVRP